MYNEIKVSVWCTAYNHEKYIRDALEGFVNQKTNFPFEVIVHDDASTDRTPEIIKEYEEKYPEIIKPIYQKKNLHRQGINRTYTYMLPNTHGKYIALCEGDDYWVDQLKLQKQFDYMETHLECSLVACEANTLFIESKKCTKFTDYNFEEKGYNLDAGDIFENHMIIPTASLFYRTKSLYDNRDFFESTSMFDYVIKSILATEGKVHVLKGVMCVYRKGIEGSWSERISKDDEKYIEHIKKAIVSYKKIDEYRERKYHAEISENIKKREFNIAMLKTDFKLLKSKKFSEIYYSLPFKIRCTLYVKKYMPVCYKVIKKIRRLVLNH